ncbi:MULTISPECIES: hypothetical protein [Pseudoalteromonas]|nr:MULTISPECIES: hypothetical protein [Pseudoalteromonas]
MLPSLEREELDFIFSLYKSDKNAEPEATKPQHSGKRPSKSTTS